MRSAEIFGLNTVIVLPFCVDFSSRPRSEGAVSGRRLAEAVSKALGRDAPPARRHNLDLPQSDDAYAICNERALEVALWQEGVVQLIALWDGGGGDGPGGTLVLCRTGQKAV